MAHIGIVCPSETGHLNPMLGLGRELQKRGHDVTVFQLLDTQQKVVSSGLKCHVIGQSEFPIGSMLQRAATLGKLSGIAGVRYTIEFGKREVAMTLRELPDTIKAADIDILLIDQARREVGSVAEFLDIPFISVCNALIFNVESKIPPGFTTWSYNPSWWASVRNQVGYSLIKRLAQPILALVNDYRQQWKLSPHTSANDAYSKLAQISQQPAEFEFPRQHLPPCFHFTGPFVDSASREPVYFPFEKLTGQPLIYASMGTLQNRQKEIFQYVAKACVGLDAQLIISLGGGNTPESMPKLPGAPLIVGYAPQLELLKKATLTITHGGLNTVLESLSNGVPMVTIPVTNDQPGVAARLAWTGAGEMLPLSRLSIPKLRDAVQRVLTEDSYGKQAVRLQEAIRRAGGLRRAADIIEKVVSTGKPVLGTMGG
ncbi:glycosyl transferase family 1 [Scytonema hofmannii PCC 7110]|uniref:Glycosyl transferase family 1 n=1 Tax=Scytonema hofmannii PCC 7110 TaxID=128403 RepID=A0A139X6M2_9CYAN|nr:glycosyltransferase [Scytonema hofmannii]KYC40334.1 glycosyl transferase family 1 [Scytonema hofmannii PCC 7110]